MRIEVAGLPAPQGSKRHVGNGRMIEMSKRVKPWRAAVEAAARQVLVDGEARIEGPVVLAVLFYLPRPQRPRWWAPAVSPDIDKVVRATCDALTAAGVWEDDARVVSLYASKRYHPQGWTGANITVLPHVE